MQPSLYVNVEDDLLVVRVVLLSGALNVSNRVENCPCLCPYRKGVMTIMLTLAGGALDGSSTVSHAEDRISRVALQETSDVERTMVPLLSWMLPTALTAAPA